MHLGTPDAAVRWVSSGAPLPPFRAPSIPPCLLHPHPLPFGIWPARNESRKPRFKCFGDGTSAISCGSLCPSAQGYQTAPMLPAAPGCVPGITARDPHAVFSLPYASLWVCSVLRIGSGSSVCREVPRMAVPLFPNRIAIVKLEESFGFVLSRTKVFCQPSAPLRLGCWEGC